MEPYYHILLDKSPDLEDVDRTLALFGLSGGMVDALDAIAYSNVRNLRMGDMPSEKNLSDVYTIIFDNDGESIENFKKRRDILMEYYRSVTGELAGEDDNDTFRMIPLASNTHTTSKYMTVKDRLLRWGKYADGLDVEEDAINVGLFMPDEVLKRNERWVSMYWPEVLKQMRLPSLASYFSRSTVAKCKNAPVPRVYSIVRNNVVSKKIAVAPFDWIACMPKDVKLYLMRHIVNYYVSPYFTDDEMHNARKLMLLSDTVMLCAVRSSEESQEKLGESEYDSIIETMRDPDSPFNAGWFVTDSKRPELFVFFKLDEKTFENVATAKQTTEIMPKYQEEDTSTPLPFDVYYPKEFDETMSK